MRCASWHPRVLQIQVSNALSKGWSVIGRLGEDGSTRRYTRVQKNHVSAILMECKGDTPGHRIDDFIRIGTWLRSIGLSAPEIYEGDEAAGYLVLEDFGDVSFKAALEKESPQKLYGLAADVLNHLRAVECPLVLPDYFRSHVHKGHRRIIDWYVPMVLGKFNDDALGESYLAAWQDVEDVLPEPQRGFLHIDFHAENLMFLPGKAGVKQCGILDFQGAMRGPAAYDLGNLLEDARIDVPDGIRQDILQRQEKDFVTWYRVLTTQFHCRLMGQFIKLAIGGKPQYLQYLPRVAAYLEHGLEDPLLKPVQSWFDQHGVTFGQVPRVDVSLVRPDAF